MEDISNVNLMFIIGEFIKCLVLNLIPVGWHLRDGFRQESPVRLSWDAVVKMFEPLYGLLKSKFPHHEHLQGQDRQDWWKTYKLHLMKGYKREKIRGEMKFGHPSVGHYI